MKSIVRNVSFLALSTLIEKVAVFFLYIYLGRILTPESYGYLSYILALSAYFSLMIDLGLPKLGIREVAAHPTLSLPLFRTVTALKLLLFFLVSGGWILFVLTQESGDRIAALMMIGYFFARAVDVQWLLQARQRFDTIAWLRVIKTLVLLTSLLLLFRLPQPWLYLLFYALAALVPTLGYLYLRESALLEWSRIGTLLRRHLRRLRVLLWRSLPLAASSFLILMYYNLDTVLIRHMLGLEEVARYTAAYKLVFAFIVARNLLHSVIFPRISRAKEEWREGGMLFLFSLGVVLLIVLVAGAYGREILELAYGEKYLSSERVFFILSLTAGVLWLNLFFPAYFIAVKKEYFYLKVQLSATALNLLANLWMIPRYGIEGAAWATLMADLLSLAIFGICYVRERHAGKGAE